MTKYTETCDKSLNSINKVSGIIDSH